MKRKQRQTSGQKDIEMKSLDLVQKEEVKKR